MSKSNGQMLSTIQFSTSEFLIISGLLDRLQSHDQKVLARNPNVEGQEGLTIGWNVTDLLSFAFTELLPIILNNKSVTTYFLRDLMVTPGVHDWFNLGEFKNVKVTKDCVDGLNILISEYNSIRGEIDPDGKKFISQIPLNKLALSTLLIWIEATRPGFFEERNGSLYKTLFVTDSRISNEWFCCNVLGYYMTATDLKETVPKQYSFYIWNENPPKSVTNNNRSKDDR